LDKTELQLKELTKANGISGYEGGSSHYNRILNRTDYDNTVKLITVIIKKA